MARILILDDEPANRYLVATVLAADRHEVIEASTADEALEQVRAHRPDLAIVDLFLRGTSGADFIKTLRAEPDIAATAVALYTGTTIDRAMRDFLEMLRIEYVIPKPSEPTEMLRIVREATS